MARLRLWGEAHPLVFLAAVVVVLLVPFLNKAVHIDDSLFVWSAEWIRKHPVDFYGFKVNWAGLTIPMYVENWNPPAQSYFLAGLMSAFGEGEWILHGGMLLVAFAGCAGIYQLARLWCGRPLLGTLIAVVTPVFLVSATTLMCDVTMLACWIWALVFWEWGLGQGETLRTASTGARWVCLLCSGLLAGLAVLTKYSALPLLPLLPLLGLLRKRQVGWWLIWLLLPLVLIEGYQLWTARLYGEGLISAASENAANVRFLWFGGPVGKCVVGFVFAGGCLLPVLFMTPLLWPARYLWWAGAGILALALGTIWGLNIGADLSDLVRLQMALFLAVGLSLIPLTLSEIWRRHDPVNLVLGAWVASQLLFAIVLNWTVSARAFLPLAPAVGILIARWVPSGAAGAARESGERLQQQGEGSGGLVPTRPVATMLLLLPCALISVLVSAADYQLANSGREAARELAQLPRTAGKLWFQGHRGFQYYLQKGGAEPIDVELSRLAPGDLMIVPANGNNLVSTTAEDATIITNLEFGVLPWVSVVDGREGTGFYGAGGWIPFAFVPAPAEKYFVDRILRPVEFSTPEQQNDEAWRLATNPTGLRNDGTRAVELARRACERTGYGRTIFVGTLAAAYANAGRFEDALAAAQKACALASSSGETNLLETNQKLMALYRAHEAFRRRQ